MRVRKRALGAVAVAAALVPLLTAADGRQAAEVDGEHRHNGPHPAAAGADRDPHAAHRAAMAEREDGAAVVLFEPLVIPDVEVIDQDGESHRFYSDLVAGRTVAINFVFTTCTTICPPMGATFGRLQRELGGRLGRDVHLISVSVDPTVDTPERLRAWGEKFGAGEGWTLVTGGQVPITRLLKALEVYTPDVTEHSPVVLVGNDAAGRWTRAYGLAPPAKLEELLTRAEAAESEGEV